MDRSPLERDIEDIQARLRALQDELDVAHARLAAQIERDRAAGRGTGAPVPRNGDGSVATH